jgi:hypothetical protein
VNCRSSAHCSQAWNPTTAPCCSTYRASSGPCGRRSSTGHVCQSPPCSSAIAAQVAQSCSVCPCSSRHRAKHLPLASPDRVAVDQRPVRQRPAGVVLEVDALGAGHLRDAEVDRIAEAPGGRQVRAGLLAGRGGDRVQGIDQHEAGALVRRHPADGAQVGQVADAPARPAARGVELHGPAPGAIVREPAATGGDDQPATAAVAGLQPVVAQREVGRQLAVDVPHVAVLADDVRLVHLQRVTGTRDDRRAVLEIGRGGADHLAQPVDGGLRDGVLLVQCVQPARVDAPLVGGRLRCHLSILTGAGRACRVRDAAGPASWRMPLRGPPATGVGDSGRATRFGRRDSR